MASTTVKSWSISKLHDYEKCPRFFQLRHVERIPDPRPSKAADRGTEIHNAAEYFVKGEGPMIKEMYTFATEFQHLRNLFTAGQVSLEGEWGFDDAWNPCDYKTAWLRMKLDASVYSPDWDMVIDYKSGKRFGNEMKHADQVTLYALGKFMRDPDLNLVKTELWYLDVDDIAKTQFTRQQAMKFWPRMDERARKMCSDNRFTPKPNIMSCKYCPYKPEPEGTGDCKVGVLSTTFPARFSNNPKG